MNKLVIAFILSLSVFTLALGDDTSVSTNVPPASTNVPPAVPALPVTYSGHVDGSKDLSNGALVVNLDGTFPNQKMSVYIAPNVKSLFPRLPVIGDTITATGLQVMYNGHPEIKLIDPSQITFANPPAPSPTPTPTPAAAPAAM